MNFYIQSFPALLKSIDFCGQPAVRLGCLFLFGLDLDDFFATIIATGGTGMMGEHLIVTLRTGK
jgi:hypothetical protein